MEFVDSRTIRMDKVVTELDKLVFDFIGVIEKHTDYVIMSGYVAILLGRSRATEDVDVFIKEVPFDSFKRIFDELKAAGFECLASTTAEGAYNDYLAANIPVRFFKDAPVPNIEVKFARKKLDFESFRNRVTAIIGSRRLLLSPIELQIAYKRAVLKSDKDFEDAAHLEEACSPIVNKERIKNYEHLIKQLWG